MQLNDFCIEQEDIIQDPHSMRRSSMASCMLCVKFWITRFSPKGTWLKTDTHLARIIRRIECTMVLTDIPIWLLNLCSFTSIAAFEGRIIHTYQGWSFSKLLMKYYDIIISTACQLVRNISYLYVVKTQYICYHRFSQIDDSNFNSQGKQLWEQSCIPKMPSAASRPDIVTTKQNKYKESNYIFYLLVLVVLL